MARRLHEAGANVAVVLTDGQPRTEQAQAMFSILSGMEIAVVEFEADPVYLAERLAETDLLVDAIYGTGFYGELDEKHRDICRLMNGVGVQTVSLDIPTGVAADTGAADDFAVCADVTIVFDSDKPATVLPGAAAWCGEVVVVDIGIPPKAREGIEPLYTVVDEEFVFGILLPRRRETHKGR